MTKTEEHIKVSSDRNQLTVKCADCGEVSTLAEVDADKIRFYKSDGGGVRFGNVTQTLINGTDFYCECCNEDREEKGEHSYYD
jgi:hypothetical protein